MDLQSPLQALAIDPGLFKPQEKSTAWAALMEFPTKAGKQDGLGWILWEHQI